MIDSLNLCSAKRIKLKKGYISKKRFSVLLCWLNIIVLGMPPGLSFLFPAFISYSLLVFGVFVFLLDLYFFIIRKKAEITIPFLFLSIFCVLFLISTAINGQDILRCVKFVYKILLSYFFAIGFLKPSFKQTISYLSFVGKIVLFLNFLIMVTRYPDGLYVFDYHEYSLIGITNSMETYWLPFALFWMIDVLINKKRFFFIHLSFIFLITFIPSFLYKSTTGYLISLMTLAFWSLVYLRGFIRISIRSSSLFWLIIIAFVIWFLVSAEISYIPILAEQTTFIQRIGLWKTSINMIKEKPLFGYGLGETDNVVYFNQWRNYSPHNLYLMIAMWGGIPLLIVFAFYYWVSSKKIFKYNDKISGLIKATLVLFLIYSIVEINNNLYLFVLTIATSKIYSDKLVVTKG